MSNEWPSALDQRISEGKADPISNEEKDAVTRFKVTYDELFGSNAQPSVPDPVLPPPRSSFTKFVHALGLDR